MGSRSKHIRHKEKESLLPVALALLACAAAPLPILLLQEQIWLRLAIGIPIMLVVVVASSSLLASRFGMVRPHRRRQPSAKVSALVSRVFSGNWGIPVALSVIFATLMVITSWLSEYQAIIWFFGFSIQLAGGVFLCSYYGLYEEGSGEQKPISPDA